MVKSKEVWFQGRSYDVRQPSGGAPDHIHVGRDGITITLRYRKESQKFAKLYISENGQEFLGHLWSDGDLERAINRACKEVNELHLARQGQSALEADNERVAQLAYKKIEEFFEQ